YAQAPAAPSNSAPFGCSKEMVGQQLASFCHIQTRGYHPDTGEYGQTGIVHLWIYWGASDTGGWMCITDTWTNGRGVKVKIMPHIRGRPADGSAANYVVFGPYKDTAGDCTWQPSFRTASGTDIDSVRVEWGDSWNKCDYCNVESQVVTRP
ncbi:MAG TPA: hypothetical protein VFQ61_35695, partial [Polyangiaceae bacterium]|nr:hypothetical protein [Polyangiaceae bacterium]